MTVKLFPFLGLTILLIAERIAQAVTTPSTQSGPPGQAGAGGKPGSKPPPKACNYAFLQALRLTGVEPGEPVTRNAICGLSAKENCCSQVDEIKIIRSWNSFTKPKIAKYAEDMTEIYNNFLNLEPYLSNLNFSNIEFHFDNVSWRRTNESQCFSGKFMLEQANYAILKDGGNITTRILNMISKTVSRTFTSGVGMSVIRQKDAENIIRQVFANNTAVMEDLLDSLNFPLALSDVAVNLATLLTNFLIVQKPPLVNLTALPADKKPFEFYNATWDFGTLFNTTLARVSDRFFMEVLKLRVARIHIASLINYVNKTVQDTLANNALAKPLAQRQVNTTELTKQIMDDLFANQMIWKYLGWFWYPTSASRYVRVYKFLENSIIKSFSDVILRSELLSEQAHYAVLKHFMTVIDDYAVKSVLSNSYSRIAGTVINHLGFVNLTTTYYKAAGSSGTSTPGGLYRLLVRANYRKPSIIDSNSLSSQYQDWMKYNLNMNLKNIWLNITKDQALGYTSQVLPDSFEYSQYDPRGAFAAFMSFNLRRARHAEFAGDNKQVCATVYRHNLVREAIFNEKKFQYCLQITQNFQNRSLAATLGPVREIRAAIDKLLELKAAFYCSACSIRDSRNVDVVMNSIRISSKFCFDFVNKFKTYLDWRYTAFQGFQNSLFQYLSCFGRDANLTVNFPYEPFNNLIPENFTAWDACRNVSSINNISLCFPVCEAISLTSFSNLIEGDRRGLIRLYNYAITVLRQYGVQYGTYIATFNYTRMNAPVNLTELALKASAASSQGGSSKPSSGSRILQERRRPVVYHLYPDDMVQARRLQAPPANSGTQATPGATAASGSTPTQGAGTGTSGGAPGAAGSPAAFQVPSNLPVKLSDDLIKDPKIQMLAKLYATLDTMTSYTRPEHYNHDEPANARDNYVPVPAIADMMNMTTQVVSRGVNPFRYLSRIRFSESMMQLFVRRQGGPSNEPLDRDVIKDCVQIGRDDINMFNDDINLSVIPTFKPVEPVQGFLQQNEALFIRYKTRRPRTGIPPKWEARDKSDLYPPPQVPMNVAGPTTRRLRRKETKKTSRGGFVSNLLFRVLF